MKRRTLLALLLLAGICFAGGAGPSTSPEPHTKPPRTVADTGWPAKPVLPG